MPYLGAPDCKRVLWWKRRNYDVLAATRPSKAWMETL